MEIAIIYDVCQEQNILVKMITKWSEKTGYKTQIFVFAGEKVFLKEYSANKFKLIFIDSIDGIEKIRKIDMHIPIVYITKDVRYIFKAVMFHIFDCIKIPYDYERISYVLDEFIKVFPSASYNQLLQFSCGKKEISMQTSDILYITADNNYTVFTTKSGIKKHRIFFSKACDIITDKRFIVCTRGVAVNMDYIRKENHGVFEMKDGNQFPIRRNGRKNIIDTFEQYKFNKVNSEKPQYEVCKI